MLKLILSWIKLETPEIVQIIKWATRAGITEESDLIVLVTRSTTWQTYPSSPIDATSDL